MLRKVVSRRALLVGEHLPFGYGIAYCDYARAQYIAFPIPLNLFVRAYRKLLQLVITYTPSQRDEDLAKARNQGFQEGLAAGEAREHARIDRELKAFLQERKQR